jgi:Na+/glutamate symporter
MFSFSRALSSPEAKQVIEQYGMQQAMKESMEMMGQMRPIDYALNVLTVNIVMGIILGLPIAAFMQRHKA